MFSRGYVVPAFAAGALAAAAEAGWHLALNAPALRQPLWRTVAAEALVAGAFVFALAWAYTAVFRVARRRRKEGFPAAGAFAALAAPLLWYTIYRLLPEAKLAWVVALVIGLAGAPLVAWALALLARRRKAVVILAGVAAFILLGLTALSLLERTRPARADRANFLLVTLDTVRADRLGCYGYAAARTPILDSLAARGLKVDPAYCLEPLTAPSHATMMTSLYPETTGVVLNGMRLRNDVPTVGEQFRAAGYATAAFVAASSVHARDTALDRGFELYDDAVTPREAYRPSPLAPLGLAEKFALLAPDDNDAERPAAAVTTAALRWFGRHRRKPFFVWVHYFDPHDDYLPPAEYAPPRLTNPFVQRRVNRRWGDNDPRPRIARYISDLYDGEIAYVDAELGRLLDGLAALGLADRTVVMVVGDHGEAFREHGTQYHGFRLYEEEVRVPFLVTDLGGHLPTPTRPPAMATTLDVAPTLLDLAGLPIPPTMRGRPLFASAAAPAPAAYGVCLPDPLRKSKYARGRLEMAARPGEKVIVSAGGKIEYYDLENDPGETEDVASDNPEAGAALRAELEALRATVDPAPAPTRAVDEETVAKLRALGYIQ
ncbi:MAG: sulfatase [Candidatus Coatesbacteria bacterium]|nr:MAG: sulfatase [Candidatus Coatesbacteria bacterium]